MKATTLFMVLVLCFAATGMNAQLPYLVKDINPGKASSQPQYLTDVNGTLFFAANDGEHGIQLWKSNGTKSGTSMVKQIMGSTGMNYFVNFNGMLYFTNFTASGRGQLWKSDGTDIGTVLVKDMEQNGVNGQILIKAIHSHNDYLYFIITFSGKTQLWKTDGSTEGTTMIKEVVGITNFQFINGQLFFVSFIPINFYDVPVLWKSDGTEVGTTTVKKSGKEFNIKALTSFKGDIYFAGYYADESFSNPQLKLWKTDGSSSGTISIASLPQSNSAFTTTDKFLYFTTNSNLWKSDGTESGTEMIKDFNFSGDAVKLVNLINVNNQLFFTTATENTTTQLWKSDGTEAGTQMVKDIYPGAFSGSSTFIVHTDNLYFTTYQGFSETGIWKSNGTDAGTVRIDTGGMNAGGITISNNLLYFLGYEPNTALGTELWAVTISNENIPPIQDNSLITISPNPFDGSATVMINADISDQAEFVLYDMLGKQVMRFTVTTQSFRIERGELSDGVYTLQWLNGNNTISQRLVIMR